MTSIHFPIVFIALFGCAVAASDYCAKDLCESGKHIACENAGDFASTCPADKQILSIGKKQIQLILKEHNKLRNKIASGNQTGFHAATKMSTMVII
jgi:hypothetical protein